MVTPRLKSDRTRLSRTQTEWETLSHTLYPKTPKVWGREEDPVDSSRGSLVSSPYLWEDDGGIDRRWTFVVDDWTSDRVYRVTLVKVVFSCL